MSQRGNDLYAMCVCVHVCVMSANVGQHAFVLFSVEHVYIKFIISGGEDFLGGV